jgi:hypothetical protein
MQTLLLFIGFTLFIQLTPAMAAEVFRCEDSKGHITFTLQGCPSDHTTAVQDAHNPTPSKGRAVAMAKIAKQASSPRQAEGRTVVAEKQDGCGNRVIGTQRRTAIIRKQIMTGMTQSDVESALGKPDEQTSRNGETRYSYKDNNGKNRQISFDQNGCVKAKH